MTGEITDTTCPHVKRLSELQCKCGTPLGIGPYEARSFPFTPLYPGGVTTTRTLVFHPECVGGYCCEGEIGLRDEPTCEGK